MIINFFTERIYPCSTEPERDLRVLFKMYLKGRFVADLVTVLPFDLILTRSSPIVLRLLLLLKLIRLYVGFELLNHKNYMK